MVVLKRSLTGLALCLALAGCGSLEEALENEECFSDDDCAPSQSCVVAGGSFEINPTGIGWCRPSGSTCVLGEQPFCSCAVDGATGARVCSASSSGMVSTPFPTCPEGNEAQCYCAGEAADTDGECPE